MNINNQISQMINTKARLASGDIATLHKQHSREIQLCCAARKARFDAHPVIKSLTYKLMDSLDKQFYKLSTKECNNCGHKLPAYDEVGVCEACQDIGVEQEIAREEAQQTAWYNN